jgi:hypothetical protein
VVILRPADLGLLNRLLHAAWAVVWFGVQERGEGEGKGRGGNWYHRKSITREDMLGQRSDGRWRYTTPFAVLRSSIVRPGGSLVSSSWSCHGERGNSGRPAPALPICGSFGYDALLARSLTSVGDCKGDCASPPEVLVEAQPGIATMST